MSDPRQTDPSGDGAVDPLPRSRKSWPALQRFGLRTTALLSLGLAALLFTCVAAWHVQSQRGPVRVVISTPAHTGLKDRLIRSVAAEAPAHRLEIEHVAILDIGETVQRLKDRTLTFAVVAGGFDLTGHKELRQVAALNIDPLQLVVKEEIHADILEGLHNLKGKRVQIGTEEGTIANLLGVEILTLAGLKVGTADEPGDIVLVKPTPALVKEPDREKLPDAFFMVSGLPSPTIRELTTKRGFRLVPLPYAKVLRQGALADDESKADTGESRRLLKERVTQATIPATTYQIDPAIPEGDLTTVGTRVLVITHRATANVAVERMLETLYASRGLRKYDPPLAHSVVDEFQELSWHAGALRYSQRNEPFLTGAMVGNVANGLQIVLPALTALLFVWQWLRQRTRSRRQDDFQHFQDEIIKIESEVLRLDEPRGNLPRLRELERQLGRLKLEVLAKFEEKSGNGSTTSSDLLLQIHDARTHLGSLISRATS